MVLWAVSLGPVVKFTFKITFLVVIPYSLIMTSILCVYAIVVASTLIIMTPQVGVLNLYVCFGG